MSPRGIRQQLMQVAFLLLVISFAAHLLWDWMTYITPMLMALAALAVIYRLLFRGRR
jgi:hypothetical protein